MCCFVRWCRLTAAWFTIQQDEDDNVIAHLININSTTRSQADGMRYVFIFRHCCSVGIRIQLKSTDCMDAFAEGLVHHLPK